MTIIGLLGKMGSGKTTVANILINNHSFTEYAFAKPIKDIGLIFGFSQEQLYGTQAQKLEIHPYWGISGRLFMQKIGDIFRNNLKETIPEMKIQYTPFLEIFKLNFKENCNYVISDVRFKDEAEFIKSLGGILIKIERNNLSQTEHSSHISETEMESIIFDNKIENNLTIEKLEEEINLYI